MIKMAFMLMPAREVATFPREMAGEFLEAIRREAGAGQQDDTGHRAFAAPGMGGMFHQLSQYFYDCEKRERRLGNMTDYIEMLKMGDVLYPDSGVGQCFLMAELPAPIEPLVATLLQFEHVRRPRGAYVQDVRQIDYLAEMEEISGCDDLTWLANCGFASPLRLGRDIAARFAYSIKHDRPANLYIMTISGAGSPVTVAGTIVLAAAEFLANWMAGRALNPDCERRAGAWIATMDMRGGDGSYSAQDALVRNLAIREFMRRWTGVTVGAGGGGYHSARVPGIHAAVENAHATMTVAAFTGEYPGGVSGHLEGGLTFSPVQLLLDREMATAIGHLAGPVEVTGETIGLEAILEVGHEEKTKFIETDHTLRHFRSALWLPQLMDRSGWNGLESEETAIQNAQAKVNELIASYEKPEVDGDKLAKLREVVDRARRALT